MSNVIARTGRVQSWIDDPEGRLPVSCTVFVPTNSLDGPDGITNAIRYAIHGLRYGAGVAIHLSQLDGRGMSGHQALLRLALYHLGEFSLSLTRLSGEVVSTKTEQ